MQTPLGRHIYVAALVWWFSNVKLFYLIHANNWPYLVVCGFSGCWRIHPYLFFIYLHCFFLFPTFCQCVPVHHIRILSSLQWTSIAIQKTIAWNDFRPMFLSTRDENPFLCLRFSFYPFSPFGCVPRCGCLFGFLFHSIQFHSTLSKCFWHKYPTVSGWVQFFICFIGNINHSCVEDDSSGFTWMLLFTESCNSAVSKWYLGMDGARWANACLCACVCVSKNATQIQCVNHAWPQEYGVRDVSLSLGLPFSFNQSQLMLKHMLYGRIRNDVMRQLWYGGTCMSHPCMEMKLTLSHYSTQNAKWISEIPLN